MVSMKDMSVYKAEVFRRSEKRIAARRAARNRVLAFCIPLVLFIGIWSVMILPAMLPAGSSDLSPEEEMIDGGSGSLGNVISYNSVKIEILDLEEEVFQEYSHISNVEKLYSLIHSYFSSNEITDESTEQKQESAAGTAPENEATDSNKKLQCRIIFASKDGRQRSYLLYQNTISDEQTGQIEVLSEKELQDLKAYFNAT